MTGKSHWPFGGDPWGRSARTSSREPDSAKAQAADQNAMRQRARNDRLIVGGRAHTKKSGLS